jgi:hypothetical protein
VYQLTTTAYFRALHPRVTAIRVNQAEHKVLVSLEADASSLFPALLRGVVVRGEGEAEVRLTSR